MDDHRGKEVNEAGFFLGFEYWGNWNWEYKLCEDLFFSNNRMIDCGETGIWGAGGKQVILEPIETTWDSLFESLSEFPEDFMEDVEIVY